MKIVKEIVKEIPVIKEVIKEVTKEILVGVEIFEESAKIKEQLQIFEDFFK